MISTMEVTEIPAIIFEKRSDVPPAVPHPTLNEIQIRAYRIHQRHGAVYGGYNLDDWLEAEHELEKELQKKRTNKTNVQ
jgi:Protein of unknown function (DUF2934)